ncbi:MAG: hypothetical protein NVV73_21875 [Cellvibrionaceae bacterium]|nr:hypothetical protein [Cellvibrionaceae bacterium]
MHVTRLNERFEEMGEILKAEVVDEKTLKEEEKNRKRRTSRRAKQKKRRGCGAQTTCLRTGFCRRHKSLSHG